MSEPAALPHVRGSIWTGPISIALAWLLWGGVAVAISILVARNPETRTVTGEYRQAAISFLNSRPMYSPGAMGWLYPVQSAMAFVPFTFEPRAAAEILWRLVGIAGLVLSLWRLAFVAPFTMDGVPRPRHNLFFLLSLFVLPPAMGAIRNGQINVHLAALFLAACAAVMRQRWGMAALWLCLALAAKPTSIVILLLFTAIHRPLWWRVAVGIAIVAAAPLLHTNWSYILPQYGEGLKKVVEAGSLSDFDVFHPADLTSLLHLVGIHVPESVLTGLRALAAVFTLGLCWLAVRRFDRRTAAVLVLGLGTAYLMVFNPRTEGNTYVIFAPPLALLTCWSLVERRESARSIILVAACVLLGFCQFLVPHEREYWIRPAETIVLSIALSAALLVPRWRAYVPRAPRSERVEPSR